MSLGTDWRPWALRAHDHTPISHGHERLAHTPLSSVGRKWVHFSLSRIRAAGGAAARATRARRERTPCVYVSVDSSESKQLQQRRSTGRNHGPDGRWTELFAVAGLRFPRCRRRNPPHSCTQRATEGDQPSDSTGRESPKRPLHKADRWIHPHRLVTDVLSGVWALPETLCVCFRCPDDPRHAVRSVLWWIIYGLALRGSRCEYQPTAGCARRRLHGPRWWTREKRHHNNNSGLIWRAEHKAEVYIL